VPPDPRRELVRDFDLGPLSFDRKESDLAQEFRRLFELERPEPEAGRLTRREGHGPREALSGLGDILRRRARRPLHHLGRTEHFVKSSGILVAVQTDNEPFRRQRQRH